MTASFSRRFPAVLTALFLGAFCAIAPAQQTPPAPVAAADAVQEAFVRVASAVKPSVVTIQAERVPSVATPGKDKPKPDEDDDGDDDGGDTPFGSPFGPSDPDARRISLGTGMIIQADGYILTNYHVVKDAAVIRIIFDAERQQPEDRATARLVGFDEEADLAVLKVARTGLTPVTFGDSDKVRIGEWAMAIGAPFDQAQTVTVGIISAKSRYLEKAGQLSLQDYIQTDASINPGNSGGPLVDLQGEVIGINTAILSPSRFNVGIGFAAPSNSIREFLPRLLKGEPIQRGFLGIQYVQLDKDVAHEFGLLGGMQIGALATKDGKPIGPAKDAGLKEGDIITGINGQEMLTSDIFRRAVSSQPPGTKLTFNVARPTDTGLEKRDVTVTLGDWNVQHDAAKPQPTTIPARPSSSPTGLHVEDVTKLTATQKELFDIKPTTHGVVITGIEPNTPADDAQLARGLRLVRLRVSGGAWQPIASRAAFERIEKTLKPGDRVLLQLRDRDDVSVYKVIILPDKPATG
jgi:serine protease Do